jgi:hypothetical protein
MHNFDFHDKDFDWQKFIGKPYHKHYPERKNMAYNKFTKLAEAVDRLNLKVESVKRIIDTSDKQEPSEFIVKALQRGTALAMKIGTEKARSEMIVAPILMEIIELSKNKISLYSGVDFRVDVKRGLNGRCDFMIGQGTQLDTISSPVLTIIEAKNDNVRNGIGQCVAEMVAAQIFNEKEKRTIQTVYGTVTNGISWLFMKLEEQTVFIEEIERVYDFERNLDELLGILLKITETQN